MIDAADRVSAWRRHHKRLWGLCLLLALCGGCATTLRWQEAYSLVTELAGPATEAGIRPREVRYQRAGRGYTADLYQPVAGARASVALLHGFTELGKADPRLRRFAEALAAARFQVLVPELTSLTQFRVGAANIEAVADAVAYLQTLPQPPGGRLGLVAISYAGGPAVLAAAGEASAAVNFVFCIGTYYDLTEAITFATTGWYRDHGELRYRPPVGAGRWLLLFGHGERLIGADGELLREIAQRRLQDPSADVTALAAALGAPGRAVYALASNRDPERVPALIAALPESLRREFQALDLAAQDMSGLKAELILLHGRDDPMIPAEHSEALAGAIPNQRVQLFLVDGLTHVELQPRWRDALALWQAAVALLKARDGVSR